MEPVEAEIDPKYHFLEISQAAASRAHIVAQYFDRWWAVHPEKGLVFYGKGYASPQCNSNESIARRLCPTWAILQFIDVVRVPVNINDYVN